MKTYLVTSDNTLLPFVQIKVVYKGMQPNQYWANYQNKDSIGITPEQLEEYKQWLDFYYGKRNPLQEQLCQ